MIEYIAFIITLITGLQDLKTKRFNGWLLLLLFGISLGYWSIFRSIFILVDMFIYGFVGFVIGILLYKLKFWTPGDAYILTVIMASIPANNFVGGFLVHLLVLSCIYLILTYVVLKQKKIPFSIMFPFAIGLAILR